ncbi:MAG: energy transducer TonB [Edaphocola sp.]
MHNTQSSPTGYLEILFQHRNQQYGSYVLRKGYNVRAAKALGITLSSLLLALALPLLAGKTEEGVVVTALPHTQESLVTYVASYKPPKKIELADTRKAYVKTVKSTVPKIVANNQVPLEDKPAENKELEKAIAGPVYHDDEGGEDVALSKETHKGPLGNGHSTLDSGGSGLDTSGTSVVLAPEVMPEFPGGEAALRQWLSQNLRYPPQAIEEGIEGRVYVSFIVNSKGDIEGATLKRKVWQALDKEALRAVNAMPKWKPGKQNGRPVKVCYTLPISFVLQH